MTPTVSALMVTALRAAVAIPIFSIYATSTAAPWALAD